MKERTNLNSTYTTWLIALIAEIVSEADLTPDQIAINEEEVKEYYNGGNTPSYVFNQIWYKDAGNYYAF